MQSIQENKVQGCVEHTVGTSEGLVGELRCARRERGDGGATPARVASAEAEAGGDDCAHRERGDGGQGTTSACVASAEVGAGGDDYACRERGGGGGGRRLHVLSTRWAPARVSSTGCAARGEGGGGRRLHASRARGGGGGGYVLGGAEVHQRGTPWVISMRETREGEGGTYTDTAACSAVERELVGKDRDVCGIGAERADVLRVQRGKCAEHAQAGVGRYEKTAGSELVSIKKNAHLS